MDVSQQIIAAAEKRAAALAAADAQALGELLHDRFRWTTHQGEVLDRSEYIRRNTEGHTVWHSQTLTDTAVIVVGASAVLLAEVLDEVSSTDNAVETYRMPMTQVWVRSDNAWKCLAGHAGPRRK